MARPVIRRHLAQVTRVRSKGFPHGSGAPVLIFGSGLEFCRRLFLVQPCSPLQLPLSLVPVGPAPLTAEQLEVDPLWLPEEETPRGSRA